MASSNGKKAARKPVTLHTVAAAAGCSIATVSKALNGLPVSSENFDRVFAAAEKLGYVPNQAARSMRGVKTMTLGVVVNINVHPEAAIMDVIHTLVTDMEAQGYCVLVSIVHDSGPDLDNILRRFIERRVDGLVCWNLQKAKSVSWYGQAGVPVLAVAWRDDAYPHVPLITIETQSIFKNMVRMLRSYGHRLAGELVLPHQPPLHNFSASRGLKWREFVVGITTESVKEAIAPLIGARDAPTVFLAPTATALQILTLAEQTGWRVPDDFSLIATQEVLGAPLLRTPLSCMWTDYERLGHAVSAATMEALAGRRVNDVFVEDAGAYLGRASVGPAPKRS